MTLPRWRTQLLLLLVGSHSLGGCPSRTPPPMRYRWITPNAEVLRPADGRQSQALTLPNGMQVLLISDPKAKRSAAALDVEVGAFDGPRHFLGLAHFVEHMLFLGTRKYPKVGEYKQYLARHGGWGNAYTSGEHTNYHFQVTHRAFPGTLDRFAQFFIAPTFSGRYLRREINAVDAEHRKNYYNFNRNMGHLQRTLACRRHPSCQFTTGDARTLRGVTPAVAKAFFERHYSANQMRLVLISKHSLQQQQRWVRRFFSAVPNRKLATRRFKAQAYDARLLPLLVTVPDENHKQLRLLFQVPNPYQHWRSHPLHLLVQLVGDEGPGSLHSLLKRKDLARGVITGRIQYRFAATFFVRFLLTKKGVKRYEEVIENFFSFIKLLRRTGLQRRTFQDFKKMRELHYIFREHRQGATGARYYAALMRLYPATEIDKRRTLFYRHDPKLFQRYLELIVPSRMRVFLVAPGLKSTRKDKHFDFGHHVRPLSPELVAAIRALRPHPELAVQPPNPFLPTNLKLVARDSHKKPYRLIDDHRGLLWFLQDRTVRLPKARVSLTLVSRQAASSVRNALLSRLYVQAFRHAYSEFLYPLRAAGLRFRISTDSRGIHLTFYGFSSALPRLMLAIAKRLKTLPLSRRTYKTLKQELGLTIGASFARYQAQYALRALRDPHYVHGERFAKHLASITLEDLRRHAKRLFSRFAIKGVAYGNLTPQTLKHTLTKLLAGLGGKRLPRDQWPVTERVQLAPGQHVVHWRKSEVGNHAWAVMRLVGARSTARLARLLLLRSHLRPRFFHEMRTKRQMGYIAQTWARYTGPALWLGQLVQSPRVDPQETQRRVSLWLPRYLTTLQRLPASRLASYKASLLAKLKAPFNSMADWHRHLYRGAYVEGGGFDYRERLIRAVRAVTQADLVRFARKVLGPEAPRITVGIYKQNTLPKPLVGTHIKDLHSFAKQTTKRIRFKLLPQPRKPAPRP